MAVPSVKGYMPLCVTPRSSICDEQGVGQWPMWKRFDNIKNIVDQYIEEPYRNFLALPSYEIDKLKAEELFYWYTPRCDVSFIRLSHMGDDHDYYKGILDKTIAHYQSVVEKLKNEGKKEASDFLRLSLKYAGESEDNIYCGDGRVVATLWGMRTREKQKMGESKLYAVLVTEEEMRTVRFELGNLGSTNKPTTLKKRNGTPLYAHQIPSVTPKAGFECTGWDRNPFGVEVTGDLLFTAQYRELPKKEVPPVTGGGTTGGETNGGAKTDEKAEVKPTPAKHRVRFLTPDNTLVKEVDVEHGQHIKPEDIPQLPAVNNVLCPSWEGDPLKDVIVADRDYKALKPKEPKKPQHKVRFLNPDGQEILQMEVEDGTKLSDEMVPPLPVVKGKACPSWDTDPVGQIINADHDFVAQPPKVTTVKDEKKEGKKEEKEEQKLHTVRFLNDDGGEIMRTQVQHGDFLKPDQIPPLPEDEDKKIKLKWEPNPTKQSIKRDTDFKLHKSRGWYWSWGRGIGGGRGFWRWLLYIVLFILLVFLVLYIMYLFDPCSR